MSISGKATGEDGSQWVASLAGKMERSVSLSVVCFLAIFAAIMILVSSDPEKKDVKECVGRHVCTTLMRYPDNFTADEGPNCLCRNNRQPACNGEWEEDSTSTLTWQHYERSHWTVQYKFCQPLMQGKAPCKPGERAATVATEIKSWHPDLGDPRCRCHGLYKMDGWRREGNQWKYFYVCDMAVCTQHEAGTKKLPCARIYLDRYKSNDKVLEVKFDCACPEGQMCPAHMKKKDDPEILTDSTGSYVMNYCENNIKTASSKD